MTNELAAAIAAVKRATPANAPWTASDFSDAENPPDIDRSIATILNAVVSGDLAEVIALRAEVERSKAYADAGWDQYRHWVERYRVAADERDANLARATAAEADAERLAVALTHMVTQFQHPDQLADQALAAHTQRVNAKDIV